VDVRLAPPPSLGADTAVVDFGGSIALGNSTTPTPCMTSCRASIPATAGQALYYRVRYLDGAGNVLPTGGGVQQVIP
jgi:hypothetical protein